MKNLAKKDHQTVLIEIEKAVKKWYMAGGELSPELVVYLTTKPETKLKAWWKEVAYFLKEAKAQSQECNFSRKLPDDMQAMLILCMSRGHAEMALLAPHLRREFFSKRNLAKIRMVDKTYSYLTWYKFNLDEAILFWQRLEKEREENSLSQLVRDMEKFAEKYLTYHPLIKGFLKVVFQSTDDRLMRSIISMEVSSLIVWSSERFPEVDEAAVIDFCDTEDFRCYVKKFGLTPDMQDYLCRSGKKEKIKIFIDEVGKFEDEVYQHICQDTKLQQIVEYYEDNSIEPIVVNL